MQPKDVNVDSLTRLNDSGVKDNSEQVKCFNEELKKIIDAVAQNSADDINERLQSLKGMSLQLGETRGLLTLNLRELVCQDEYIADIGTNENKRLLINWLYLNKFFDENDRQQLNGEVDALFEEKLANFLIEGFKGGEEDASVFSELGALQSVVNSRYSHLSIPDLRQKLSDKKDLFVDILQDHADLVWFLWNKAKEVEPAKFSENSPMRRYKEAFGGEQKMSELPLVKAVCNDGYIKSINPNHQNPKWPLFLRMCKDGAVDAFALLEKAITDGDVERAKVLLKAAGITAKDPLKQAVSNWDLIEKAANCGNDQMVEFVFGELYGKPRPQQPRSQQPRSQQPQERGYEPLKKFWDGAQQFDGERWQNAVSVIFEALPRLKCGGEKMKVPDIIEGAFLAALRAGRFDRVVGLINQCGSCDLKEQWMQPFVEAVKRYDKDSAQPSDGKINAFVEAVNALNEGELNALEGCLFRNYYGYDYSCFRSALRHAFDRELKEIIAKTNESC